MSKLAIIVPYRNREEHLEMFIPMIKDYLDFYKMNYEIFIVHQTDDNPFNRGKLLNIGYVHSRAKNDYVCFHDIDMIPKKADYSLVAKPTHIAALVEQFDYKLPFQDYFGGVVLFTKKYFEKINGYSNEYWGWGAEDDDLSFRCRAADIDKERRDGIFSSLYHDSSKVQETYSLNKERLDRVYEKKIDYLKDGLSSLRYKLISIEDYKDYKMINVQL